MSALSVRQVDARVVRPLRHEVLRSGRPAEAAWFSVDDLDSTVHLAVMDGEVVIGCATVFPEAYDDRPAWRLRGMAVAADRRGRGVGSLMLRAACDVALDSGSELLWCNARTTALDFYRRKGFRVLGDEFMAAGVPHRVALLELSSTPREAASATAS